MAATQDADERAPLLSRSADSEFAASIQDKEEVEFNIWRDLAGLTRQAIPIFLSFAVQNAVQTISVLTVGRLGSFELEVSSYGFMFFSATGTMLAIGGATALDTLCGQAFTSQTVADDPQILGLLLQQCLVAQLGLFVLLIVPIWIFSAHLFTALGQEQAFASATARFLLLMLPAGVFQVVGESLKKFLQVQGASNVVGVVTAATSVVAVIINFVFVHYTGLKLWGVPCAFGVYQLLTAVGLLSVILSMPAIRKTCRMSMKGTMHGFPTLLFYAVTGILTIATEWWSFEILAMMAARLNQDSIGAQSVLMSSDLLFTTVALGISVASSHRIGGLLGAGKGLLASKAVATPYLLSFIIGAVEFVVILSVRNQYGRIFTTNLPVIEKTAQVLPLMAGFQVLDLSNGGASGILRGAGKNHLSGACNFFAYYGVGLTSAWYMCFRKGYGLYGLWAGIISGSGFLLVLQSICIWSVHWKRLGERISRQG